MKGDLLVMYPNHLVRLTGRRREGGRRSRGAGGGSGTESVRGGWLVTVKGMGKKVWSSNSLRAAGDFLVVNFRALLVGQSPDTQGYKKKRSGV